jgi:hypothetical protein
MNRTVLSVLLLILCFASLALTASNGKVHAQALPTPLRGYSIVIPYPGSHEDAMAAMAAIGKAATIPLSRFTFTASKDGRQYTEVIVGQNICGNSHPDARQNTPGSDGHSHWQPGVRFDRSKFLRRVDGTL